jgi:hypothetical protein
MNYATWKLNFTDPKYGTGPEEKISELGLHAEAAWLAGDLEDGGTVLGYVSEPIDETELTSWEFVNISQEEALSFCLEINESAYLSDNGRIIAPIEEITI